MTPSFAVKKGVRYRYYVSAVLAQGRKGEAGSISRIASDAIESVVLDSLARPTPPQIVDAPGAARDSAGAQSGRARIEGAVGRVVISDKTIEIWRIKNAIVAGGDQPDPLVVAWSPQTFFRKREIIQPVDGAGDAPPLRAETRDKLLAAIAKARFWLADVTKGDVADIETIAARENITLRSARMILSLAFLAPNIVKAAANGTLPRGFGVSRLTDLPADWAEQHRKLGLPVAG